MSTTFQPPPTYTELIVIDPNTNRPIFNPTWLRWFYDLNQFINTNYAVFGVNPTPVAGAILYGTGTQVKFSSVGSSGDFLVSNGSSAPAWQTILAADHGGTGLSSYTPGDLIYAFNATTLAKLPDVANGSVLLSGGINTAPSYGKVNLTIHVTGVLPEANGGTSQSTYAKGDFLYASATNTLSKLTAPASASYLTINATGVPAWKHPAVGAFYDTTNQSATANTPTAITLNGTYITDNISIGSPTSRVVITNANTYSITFSLQLTNPDVASDRVYCWLRVNGTDVANSNSAVDVPGKHAGIDGSSVLAVNFFYTFTAGDYFELVWMTTNGTTSITTIPASVTPAYPAAPGVILTVSDNIAV